MSISEENAHKKNQQYFSSPKTQWYWYCTLTTLTRMVLTVIVVILVAVFFWISFFVRTAVTLSIQIDKDLWDSEFLAQRLDNFLSIDFCKVFP
jgi:hypothetical protein